MIIFEALKESHFPLLLKWLEASHVKKWWDPHINWTSEMIYKKYRAYVLNDKEQNNFQKKVYAYIVCMNSRRIGYIQSYNAHNFPRDNDISLIGLPESLAALDIFIGEGSFVGKGWGSHVIEKYCQDYIDPHFEACFLNVEYANFQAIRSYEKAGFVKFTKTTDETIIGMIRKNKEIFSPKLPQAKNGKKG